MYDIKHSSDIKIGQLIVYSTWSVYKSPARVLSTVINNKFKVEYPDGSIISYYFDAGYPEECWMLVEDAPQQLQEDLID